MSQLKGVEISLKPIAGGVNRVLPPGINQLMQQEYASRYLESIGAYATRENVEFVLTNLAIQDALVLPIWARSKVLIIPGMNNKDGIELGASIQDVLSDDYEYEEKIIEKKSTSKPIHAGSVDGGSSSMFPNLQTAYTCLVGRKLSWTTANTLDLVEPLAGVLAANKRIAESFKMLLRPPEFGTVDIQNALFTFITALPDYVPRVKYDKTFELFKSVRRLLKSKQCVQLYGLLIHFCYWNIIHPTVRQAIQTLRETTQDADDASFRDVDLNANEAIRLRAQGSPATVESPLGPRQQSRTPMSLEKLFADEVFTSEEGAQRLTLSILAPYGKEANNRGNSQLRTGATLSSQPPSPPTGEVSSLYQPPSGSRKVAFGVLGTVDASNPSSRAASPARQSVTGDGVGYQSEDRHDGSPLGSPLRGRAHSCYSELGAPGPGGMGASGRSGYFDSGANEFEGCLVAGGSLGGASEETEASLSAAEKEQLFMQIEVCLLGLFKQVGHKRADLVTGRQAMVTCCHFVVDEILTAAYPWFATLPNTPQELDHAVHAPDYLDYLGHGRDWHGACAESIRQLNLRLRRLVHQGMADIVDPSRLYTSSMLLSTVTGKLQLKSLATKGKSRFYTTSAATKAVLGDSHSDAARRFIQQGRGVYTVLPGVVDANSTRPSTSTGRLVTARKDFIYDAMRDSQQRQQQYQHRDDDLQSLDNSVHRLDAVDPALLVSPSRAGLAVHRSATEPATLTCARRIGNRFPDNHARTCSAHRPSTGSAAGGRQSARPGTPSQLRGGTQGGAARGACAGSGAGAGGGKRIDFQRLFDDQPAANYFPVIKERTSDAARAAQEALARENDWLDQFLPAGSRASSATQQSSDAARPISQAQRSRPSTSASTRLGTSSGGATTARTAMTNPGTGNVTAVSAKPSTAVSHFGAATASRPSTAASALGTARAPDAGLVGSSGASVGSASYLTADNRSLAHNKAAPLELSLRAKATLMELMVNKTAALYSSEIQTDVVRTRVALLRNT